MSFARVCSALGLLALGAACVTINVYFPAAAAEKAADQIIDEVWGEDIQGQSPGTQGAAPQSGSIERSDSVLGRVVSIFIPAAHAQQPDLDISSPGIKKLEQAMKQRHGALSSFYASGAAGLTADGLVAVRDAKAAPLKDRATLGKLVDAENADRNALYAEIARANGHPEWEDEIRATFARRWADKAQSGWWTNGPAWTQKN